MVLFVAVGLGPRHSAVDVSPTTITVRFGWGFHARIDRSAVTGSEPYDGRVWSWGAHGWRGRWLVNGSSQGIVIVHFDPVQRGYVLGFPVRGPRAGGQRRGPRGPARRAGLILDRHQDRAAGIRSLDMGDVPWQGDACSLVDAFRRGDRSPVEELEARFAAIDASELNAFCHLPREAALAAASAADVTKPFGGVPIGVKELDAGRGLAVQRGLCGASPIASPSTRPPWSRRLVDDAGVVLAGQTTASEFGGVNLTRTVLHGTTRNPWRTDRTPGGSSGGSAAAVAGGLVTIATGSDGGGSIRIPAGFTGLVRPQGDVREDPPGSAPRRSADLHVDHGLPGPVGAGHGALVRRVQRSRRS